jgi:mono/diheme cytochrome c family protein
MQHRPFVLALFAAAAAPALGAATVEPTEQQKLFFEGKVRPILVDHCYKCHSLEEKKSKGGLTMDTKTGLLKGGDGGAIVVPGDPAKSPMITAINYLDPDLQMPPKGEKLTNQQIADLTEWVKMGAPDPRKDDAAKVKKLSGLTDSARSHWAYQPVTKPAPPAVKNTAWPRTSIDQFILAKLEEKGMNPAPDATKEALLRRATYGLTGLPPTPQEVQAFAADTSPQAFAKVVDRLLASPAYGERWGRHWLDTARYSDTVGGDRNIVRTMDYKYPYAWTYRDWVIKAFNTDMPYDKFIMQQLAADKLTDNKPEDLAALGFLTVGERFRNVNDIINDRIDVVSKGFLGLTVACARCHDHMFDPIPTKDYYALHGVFASTIEPQEKPLIGVASPEQLADYQQKLAELEQSNRERYYQFIGSLQTEFFNKIDGYLLVARYGGYGGKKGASAEKEKERIEVQNKYKLERELVQAFFRQARTDEAVFGPFRAFAELKDEDFGTKTPEILAQIASGGTPKRPLNPLVVAAFKDAQPKSIEEVAAIYKTLFVGLEPQRKAYLDASAKATQAPVSGFTPEVVQLLNHPFNILPAPEATTQKLRDFQQTLGNQLQGRSNFYFAKMNELELTHPGAPARPMLVNDAFRAKDSAVFIRGESQSRGDIVPRHFLEVLSPDRKPLPFKEGSGRLELAQSIASNSNPLTARVLVNRVWMHHFGEGFVRTLDDLGVQSEPPSHKELLDYLASNFMEQGWSLKKLHKAIMLSRVYQESSQTNPKFETMDPENRLLWRANIRRLDFEALRDSLLVFSGKLDRTVGGKPVNLTEEPYSYRRSVYGYIDRGNLPELMQQFDFSDPDMPNSKRASTTVPQQALFLMNSSMSVDVARRVVARPEVAGAGDELSRLIALYRVIFQRAPKPPEIQLAMLFVAKEAQNQPTQSPAEEKAPAGRLANRKAAQGKKGNGRYDSMAAIKNVGELVERKPLTPWETYAQALLLSNEASYVN